MVGWGIGIWMDEWMVGGRDGFWEVRGWLMGCWGEGMGGMGLLS